MAFPWYRTRREMDLCESMIAPCLPHRCRTTVADRCTVAESLKRRLGQGFTLQRCPVNVIVATHRCSHFSVADRCTVAAAHNALIHKGRDCNGDRCSAIVVATPLFIRGGVATMNLQRMAKGHHGERVRITAHTSARSRRSRPDGSSCDFRPNIGAGASCCDLV